MNDGLPFQDGEQVLLTDQRGKRHLIFLRKSETFHSDRGWVPHDAIIGQPEGSWVRSSMGLRYLALRPTLAEYVPPTVNSPGNSRCMPKFQSR